MKATGKQLVEIELSEAEQLRITREYLRKRFDFDQEWFIEGASVMCAREEYFGSHSKIEFDVVRRASAFDRQLADVLHALRRVA